MIEELAKVVAIEQGRVTVTSEIKSSCSGCQQVDNCGSGQVAKAIPHKRLTVSVDCSSQVNVGDTVVLGLSEDKLLTSASMVYLLPLLGLIIFAGVMQYLSIKWQLGHELWVILAAVLGGYLGFLVAKYMQQHASYAKALAPKIIRVIPQVLATK